MLQIFKIGAVGKVAGCGILDGFVRVGNNIRILRGNLVVYEGKLQSLRSVKEAVDQVDAPNDCGISFNDFQGMEVCLRAAASHARVTGGAANERVAGLAGLTAPAPATESIPSCPRSSPVHQADDPCSGYPPHPTHTQPLRQVDDRVEAYLPNDDSAVFESYGAEKSQSE